MKKQSWPKIAKTVFGRKATLNSGDGSGGQFALVTLCRDQVDFSLWATREGAEKMKAKLNRVGCCGECWRGRHYIVDLEEDA